MLDFMQYKNPEFKIGDRVMANCGRYGNTFYRVDVIVGETKTLWKCNKFSFTKNHHNTVRGTGGWEYIHVEPYDEKVIEEFSREAKAQHDYSEARKVILSIDGDYAKMQLFADWVNENLKDKSNG